MAERQIRVFISSTFRDMHAERDYLSKFTFPELRKFCESRGVVWGEVDLRWGITDEEIAEGQVLPLCLEEIKRCRPYFIGLLGQRYGWVPQTIPADVLEQEPWLQDHGDRSVTELEILKGVLGEPEMAEHAFFYFRDPAYLQRLPAGAQQEDFLSESAESEQKLNNLKRRIRDSGLPIHENYTDPAELGRLVLRDLKAVIDNLYPEGLELDPLDRQKLEHAAFSASRSRVYIGRKSYMDRLDEHVNGEELPLVMLGESGSGKSALLANWAASLSGKGKPVIEHYIGASADSADWAAMLRRLLGEFNRLYDLKIEIPDRPDALRSSFANALHMCGAAGGSVIVIDGLNQLEDRDGALDLVWLPPVVPKEVRMVLSTLPGKTLDELQKRNWPSLHVEPLEVEERTELIGTYLKKLYSKSLSQERSARIAGASQASSPLFLRALLEELRLFGEHDRLDERIGYYLEASSMPDLFTRILKRYEDDYERERPGLVRDAMSLIWASRRGLSETELLELLSSEEDEEGKPIHMPRAYWSPLYLASEASLVRKGGLLTFFHDYFREAVRRRYLSLAEEKAAHLFLANYFGRQELTSRRIDEEPWQLDQAEAWERLDAWLTDPARLVAKCAAAYFEVLAHWTRVEENSTLKVSRAYSPVVDAPEEFAGIHIWCVSRVLSDRGNSSGASVLWSSLSERSKAVGDLRGFAVALDARGCSVRQRGNLEDAMVLHKESERIFRELGYEAGLQNSFGNQALILLLQGAFDEAMVLFKEQERICRQLGISDGLPAALGGQAVVLRHQGDDDGATKLLEELVRICREVGNRAALAVSFENQATGLGKRGDLSTALTFHKQAIQVSRELGDRDGLQMSLSNQALTLQNLGKLEEAMKAVIEQEQICRELGNRGGLAKSLIFQANLCMLQGHLDKALKHYKDAEGVAREAADKKELAGSLGGQGIVLRYKGNLHDAMALHKDEERLCRELGFKEGLRTSVGNQAVIMLSLRDLNEAMRLFKEEEKLCQELRDQLGLQTCVGNQALILMARGELEDAINLLKEQERICREMSDAWGLSTSLGNQALVLTERQEYEEAASLLREQERVTRQVGNQEGLATCLVNRCSLLARMGRPTEALEPGQAALAIAEAHGYAALSAQIKEILGQLRAMPTSSTVVPAQAADGETSRKAALHYYRQGLWDAAATEITKLLRQNQSDEELQKMMIRCTLNARSEFGWSEAKLQNRLARLESTGLAGVADAVRYHIAEQNNKSRKPWWKLGK